VKRRAVSFNVAIFVELHRPRAAAKIIESRAHNATPIMKGIN